MTIRQLIIEQIMVVLSVSQTSAAAIASTNASKKCPYDSLMEGFAVPLLETIPLGSTMQVN